MIDLSRAQSQKEGPGSSANTNVESSLHESNRNPTYRVCCLPSPSVHALWSSAAARERLWSRPPHLFPLCGNRSETMLAF